MGGGSSAHLFTATPIPPRPMHARVLLLLTVLPLSACVSSGWEHPQGEALPMDPAVFAEWGTETIPLPPGFAPELPSGNEVLLFAPGWRDAESEEFWTYAFVMWIDEPLPDAERLDEMFELYYDGLIGAVAGERAAEWAAEWGPDPATVSVEEQGAGRFVARAQFPDAFGDMRPIDLRFVVDAWAQPGGAGSVLAIQASPQPEGHPIWTTLAGAVQQLEGE